MIYIFDTLAALAPSTGAIGPANLQQPDVLGAGPRAQAQGEPLPGERGELGCARSVMSRVHLP